MYKVQTKEYSLGKRWQDCRSFGSFINRFKTEAEAWAHVADYDQDGVIDRHNYRVVPVSQLAAICNPGILYMPRAGVGAIAMQSNVKIETCVFTWYEGDDNQPVEHNGQMFLDWDDVKALLPGFKDQTDDYMQCAAIGVEGLSTDTYDTQADLVRDLIVGAFDYQRGGYTIQMSCDINGNYFYVITVFRKV